MRFVYLVILGLLSCAPSAWAAPSLEMQSAVLLMRHGVRPPTHEPALSPAIAPQAWPTWKVAPGELTPHGAEAVRLLAAYDRAWLAAAGLVPASGCPAEIMIYADTDERTVATGQAYADAFAPGCGLKVGHAAARDPLFSALDTPDPGFDSAAAKAAMEQAAGGSLAALMRGHLPLFQKMQELLAPGQTAFLDLPSKISAKQKGALPKLSGPLAEGASAAEDFLLEYLEGMPPSDIAWGRASPADIAALLALHPLAYTVTARPPVIARRTAGALAARIVAGLTGGEKFTVLVGHDTNQAELGGLLDLHWQAAGYPADDPPPDGGLLFTLWRDKATGEHYVTVAYQAQSMAQIRYLQALSASNPPSLQPLPIPGCGDSTAVTACRLSALQKLLD